MGQSSHHQFASRINRIGTGTGNTFATIYTGVQDIDTPKHARVAGVTNLDFRSEFPTKGALLRLGFKQGLLRALMMLTGLGLYLYFAAA